jgi:hypothetical protein
VAGTGAESHPPSAAQKTLTRQRSRLLAAVAFVASWLPSRRGARDGIALTDVNEQGSQPTAGAEAGDDPDPHA